MILDPNLPLVLQALYAHEINVGMQSFYDGGWQVWIGDEMNGRRAEESFEREDFHEIPAWLMRAATRLYPNAASTH